jgi:hypothetical protein
MAMPPCGTFHYAGVVPGARVDRESGHWQLEDQSAVAAPTEVRPRPAWKFWMRDSTRDDELDPLFHNRLVGLHPILRIADGHLTLAASGRHRAQIESAVLEVDRSLIEQCQGGDVLTLVRTATADIGISLLRNGELVWAVGAVTVVPLGTTVDVQGGPRVYFSTRALRPRADTWVEISQSGHKSRLRGGDKATTGRYNVSVLRAFQDGLPGTYESVAISLDGYGLHEAAVRSAHLLARPEAGLSMTKW